MAQPIPSERRFRPFRAGAWAAYLLVAGVFSALISISVIRSVLKMSPGHRAEAQYLLGPAECVVKARALWDELEERRRLLTTHRPVRRSDVDWTRFRVDWLSRQRDAESACAVTAPGREKLQVMFHRLDAVMDLYTTHAVQFAGEVGPGVDSFVEALEAAKP